MDQSDVRALVDAYQGALANDSELGTSDKLLLVASVAYSASSARGYLTTRVQGGDEMVPALDRFATEVAKQDTLGPKFDSLNAWALKKGKAALVKVLTVYIAAGVVGVTALLTGWWLTVAGAASGVGESIATAGRSLGTTVALILGGVVVVPGAFWYVLSRSATSLASSDVSGAASKVFALPGALGAGAETVLRAGVLEAESPFRSPGPTAPSLHRITQARTYARLLLAVAIIGFVIGGLIFANGVSDGYNSCSNSISRDRLSGSLYSSSGRTSTSVPCG